MSHKLVKNKQKHKKNNPKQQAAILWIRPELVLGIMALILIPAAAFLLMEGYGRNPLEEIREKALWLNILLFELIALLLFTITGSVRLALRIEMVIAMIYGIANTYVVEFRTNPIVPWDIFSWRTAASVASNYDLTPSRRMVAVSLLFLVLLGVLHFVKLHLPLFNLRKEQLFAKENRKVFLQRAIPALVIMMLLSGFVEKLQDEDFQSKYYLYPFLFTPAHMTKVNGMAVTFAMNLAYMEIDTPENYEEEEMAALLESYKQTGASGGGKPDDLPNIIVIMNEAFSDMASVGEFHASEDYMPFIHKLSEGYENTVSGALQVSVCGGNTANSEFEFLTGHTMAFLPQGSIPYQQYIDEAIPAIPSYLKELGYKTVATHPYNASGWERNTIYPMLGFDQSIFREGYSGAEKLRTYISDAACMDKIIELHQQKDAEEPLFVFNVTMQNHGGYTDEYENFTPDITVEGLDNLAVEQYLSLLKRSDAAFEELITYFKTQEEKTIILFFGDHQPNDAVAGPILRLNDRAVKDLTEEELVSRYEVPYVMWANYDIAEETEADTSMNYLGIKLLEAAGLPLPAYQSFLKELGEQYPVVTSMQVQKKDGTFSNAKEEAEGLLTYQSLQYYQLFGE